MTVLLVITDDDLRKGIRALKELEVQNVKAEESSALKNLLKSGRL